MNKRFKNSVTNMLYPVFVFGGLSGVLTALIVLLYKLCAHHVIHFSTEIYTFMRAFPIWALAAVAVLVAVAFCLARLYKKYPDLSGGGTPAAVAALRGTAALSRLRSVVGPFTLSSLSFFMGVPLGTEGPCIQMGAAAGGALADATGKKHSAWKQYIMSAGASAGFSAATGTTVSGVLFITEEAYRRFSPMMLLISFVSVMFSRLFSQLLCPIFGVEAELFPHIDLPTLPVESWWMWVLAGVAFGLFSVLFLWLFHLLHGFFRGRGKGINATLRISVILLLTLAAGLCSPIFVGSGHGTLLNLFEKGAPLAILLSAVAVRTLLSLLANTGGLTGGMFLPTLAIGGVLAYSVGGVLVKFTPIDPSYLPLILALGITAAVSGMMRLPLTAMVFGVEALSLGNNLVAVLTVCATSYAVTELFGSKAITDVCLESRAEAQRKAAAPITAERTFTISAGSFAVGKQICDIFWPADTFILSLVRKGEQTPIVDTHGETELQEGDTLTVRYTVCDEERALQQFYSMVGMQ